MSRAAHLALLVAALVPTTLACRGAHAPARAADAAGADAAPATPTARLVGSDGAPALGETGKSTRPLERLPRGLVVEIVGTHGTLDWAREGEARHGELVQVRASARDGTTYVFASDLGGEATVPPVAALCDAVPAAASGCRERLRRLQLDDGVVVGFDACQTAACALVRDVAGARAVTTVDGLMALRPLVVGARRVVLATTHANPAPGLTLEEAIVYPLDGPLEPLARLAVDQIDSRTDTVTRRQGTVAVEGDGLVFRGMERKVRASDGVELSSRPLEARIVLRP